MSITLCFFTGQEAGGSLLSLFCLVGMIKEVFVHQFGTIFQNSQPSLIRCFPDHR